MTNVRLVMVQGYSENEEANSPTGIPLHRDPGVLRHFAERFFASVYFTDRGWGISTLSETSLYKPCGHEPRPMIFKNEPWCSDYCRKVFYGEIVPEAEQSIPPRSPDAGGSDSGIEE